MKVEKSLAILVLLSLVLYYSDVEEGGPFSVLTISTLSLLYFPGGFYFLADGELKNQNLFLSIVSGIIASLVMVVLLFKTTFWPGDQPMFMVSCVLVPSVTVLIWWMSLKSKDEMVGYYKAMKIRFVIFTLLTFLMYMVPTENLSQFRFRNQPREGELVTKRYQGTITPDEEVELKSLWQKK